MIIRRFFAALAIFTSIFLFSKPVEAADLSAAGGMGITFWQMNLELTDRPHVGWGIGISGRVMLRLGDHLRLQGGLIQGRFTEDDETRVKRNLIAAAIEGLLPLPSGFYGGLGLRLGADHLDMIETRSRNPDGTRIVHDYDRWSFLWHSFLTLGVLVGSKYHIEIENGLAFSYIDGQVHLSYTLVFGVYFGMGRTGSH